MKRVCLIVDHPLRDLHGLVHLGRELTRRNVEVFLVPMYQQNEVFLLRPDLVVVNYVRWANAAFVASCDSLGIRVAVMDTEGGVHQDAAAYAAMVARYADRVVLYCAWGKRQAEALADTHALDRCTVRVTGCPRYDFAVSPWLNAVPDPPIPIERFVLINTNFPTLRPRFNSKKTEVRQLVNGIGHDPGFVAGFVEQALHARGELIQAVRRLATKYADITFVIRPHPFEDIQAYVGELDQPNVRVIQAGTIFEWIKHAIVVLHYNCSTAVESFQMEKPAIMPTWIEAPLLAQPISRSVTLEAPDFASLDKMVGSAVAGQRLEVPADVAERRREVVNNFFCGNDGKSAARVADTIVEVLAHTNHIGQSASGSYAWRLIRSQASWTETLKIGLLAMLGPAPIRVARWLTRRRRGADGKSFSAAEVETVLKRLEKADPAGPTLKARMSNGRDCAVPAFSRLSAVHLHPRALPT